jgi:hypothetical protein
MEIIDNFHRQNGKENVVKDQKRTKNTLFTLSLHFY